MPGDFLDTNVLIYAASAHIQKAERATALIESGGVISVQVLNEFVNVTRKKLALDWRSINTFIDGICVMADVRAIDVRVQRRAVDLAERYRLHIYDATIVASALSADCAYLMTEDMHDGLLIEGRLRIVNPFA